MKKVLLVDDEPDVRKTLALVFERAYEVLEAGDGLEALRLARDEKPDLVFLDIAMPGMGGVHVLRALKRARAELPVIMLTGEQDIGVARRALDHGALMYVTKPYDVRYLRLQVERLLSCAAGAAAPADDKPWRIA